MKIDLYVVVFAVIILLLVVLCVWRFANPIVEVGDGERTFCFREHNQVEAIIVEGKYYCRENGDAVNGLVEIVNNNGVWMDKVVK